MAVLRGFGWVESFFWGMKSKRGRGMCVARHPGVLVFPVLGCLPPRSWLRSSKTSRRTAWRQPHLQRKERIGLKTIARDKWKIVYLSFFCVFASIQHVFRHRGVFCQITRNYQLSNNPGFQVKLMDLFKHQMSPDQENSKFDRCLNALSELLLHDVHVAIILH